MHGLIFETSVWLLAESTRLLRSKSLCSLGNAAKPLHNCTQGYCTFWYTFSGVLLPSEAGLCAQITERGTSEHPTSFQFGTPPFGVELKLRLPKEALVSIQHPSSFSKIDQNLQLPLIQLCWIFATLLRAHKDSHNTRLGLGIGS